MSYQVEFEPRAIADLNKVSKSVQERIFRKINWLANNFDAITPEALKGDLSDFFKL